MDKTLEKKKTAIIKALKKGEISKHNIDNADFRIAQRILKSQNVKPASIEKLFARLQEIKKNTNSVSEKVIDKDIEKENLLNNISKGGNIENSITDIEGGDIEKKEQAEIENSIADIENRIKNLSEENEYLKCENQSLIGEIKDKEREIRNLRNQLQQSNTVIENSITVSGKSKLDNVKDVIDNHESLLKEVLIRIENLEKQIVIEKCVTCTDKSKYYGFSVFKLSSGYWQAVRRIESHPHCIYIGRDVRLSQEKIEKWLAKYYPTMLNSGNE